jgi:hypothetical protein
MLQVSLVYIERKLISQPQSVQAMGLGGMIHLKGYSRPQTRKAAASSPTMSQNKNIADIPIATGFL